jgi:RNA polymerase sigma factor (sigma-70 family)
MDQASRPIDPKHLLHEMHWVQSLARSLVNDPNVAHDIAQDTYLHALEQPPNRSDSAPSLRTWLAKVVRSLARQSARSQSRRVRRERIAAKPEHQPSTLDVVAHGAVQQRLVNAVMKLDEPYRSTILYRYLEELETAEIAERSGVSAAAVRQRLSRGLEQLRAHLDREFDGDRGAWSMLLVPLLQFGKTSAGAASLPALELTGGVTMAKSASIVGSVQVLIGIGVCAGLIWGLAYWAERSPDSNPIEPSRLASSLTAASPDVIGGAADPATAAREPLSPASAAPSMDIRADCTVEVLVRDDSTHSPLPAVQVFCGIRDACSIDREYLITRQLGSIARADLFTDENGRCTLTVPSAVGVNIYVRPEDPRDNGAVRELDSLVPGDRIELNIDLKLAPDVHWFGRVLENGTHRPIPGAIATLVERPRASRSAPPSPQPPPETTDVATSDSRGLIEVRATSWKLQYIAVRAAGYVSVNTFAVEHAVPSDPQELLLDRGASIEARVIDLAGAPVADLNLDLTANPSALLRTDTGEPPFGKVSPPAHWSARTGPDGACRIDDLPCGVSLRPQLTRPGWTARKNPDPFVLEIGEKRHIEWKLGATCTVRGRVIDEQGKPLAGVELWMAPLPITSNAPPSGRPTYFLGLSAATMEAKSISDGSGHFHFDSVAPGRWRLGPAAHWDHSATSTETSWAPCADVFDVSEEAQSIERDVVAHPGLYIRGRVVDARGKPAMTMVALQTAEGDYVWTHTTDSDGSFAAGPAVQGEFKLTAYPKDSFAESLPVAAHAGDDDVTLKLRAGASLAGTIVDAETGDRCRAQLFLSPHASVDLPRINGNEGRDPADFLFEGIPPGLYDIAAHTADGRTALLREIDLVAGVQANVVVHVARGAKVRMRCEGKSPWGVYIVRSAGARIAQNSLTRGGVEIVDVPPGKLEIEFIPTGADHGKSVEIELARGVEKEIVFREDD